MFAIIAGSFSTGRRTADDGPFEAKPQFRSACPFFGGLPATGAIARTSANINSGGKTPLAGIIHALTLLLVILVAQGLEYAVVAGAVTGGGLTVIANAPNPAGQGILRKYFKNGVSPLKLLYGAIFPTLVMAIMFMLLAR